MVPEELLNNLETLKKGNKNRLIKCLKFSVKCTFVKEFVEGDQRPCEDNDFIEEKKILEKNINILKIVFEDIISCGFFNNCKSGSNEVTSSNVDMDDELLGLIMIMCGENAYLKPWNNEAIVNTSSDILALILRLFNFDKSSQLVSKCHKNNFVRKIILFLHPNLSAAAWKHYPASVICYKWVLKMIKQPDLSSHLSLFLPTSLLLVDDFVTENKILGVKCLHHIIKNTTIAELQFCGHGDVIYSALKPLLRIREADLNMYTIPCLISLTTKLEMDFGRKDVTRWSKFDDILEIFLENMELEPLIHLRKIYISNLEMLINASGFGIIRWTKRLLKIFMEYLEIAAKTNDKNTTNSCLKAIAMYLEMSKSLGSLYAESLFLILLIPFYSIKANANTQASETTLMLLKHIAALLSEDNSIELKVKLQEKLQSDNHFTDFYETVIDLLISL